MVNFLTAVLRRCPFRFLAAASFFGVIFAPAAESVVFYPDWFAGPQFAGVYVAQDENLFARAGLAVEISAFRFGRKTPDLIDAAPAVCGIGAIEGYIFLQQRARASPLIALAAMFAESPAGFMAIGPTPLAGARDFAGRRVGVHPFADPLFRWFVRRAGLADDAATMVFTDGDTGRLERGELDVMQGYATEEFVGLRQRVGERARFLSFRELGFDSYSEILFTTTAQSQRHATTLARFVDCVRAGWGRALADPAVALASVRRRLTEPPDDRALRARLAALAPYVTPQNLPPLAPISREKWQRMQGIALEMEIVSRLEPVENFLWPLPPPAAAPTSPAPR